MCTNERESAHTNKKRKKVYSYSAVPGESFLYRSACTLSPRSSQLSKISSETRAKLFAFSTNSSHVIVPGPSIHIRYCTTFTPQLNVCSKYPARNFIHYFLLMQYINIYNTNKLHTCFYFKYIYIKSNHNK